MCELICLISLARNTHYIVSKPIISIIIYVYLILSAINQPSKSELSHLASTLNAIRTTMLDEIKQKQLILPPLLPPDGDQEPLHNQDFQEALQTLFTARYSQWVWIFLLWSILSFVMCKHYQKQVLYHIKYFMMASQGLVINHITDDYCVNWLDPLTLVYLQETPFVPPICQGCYVDWKINLILWKVPMQIIVAFYKANISLYKQQIKRKQEKHQKCWRIDNMSDQLLHGYTHLSQEYNYGENQQCLAENVPKNKIIACKFHYVCWFSRCPSNGHSWFQ